MNSQLSKTKVKLDLSKLSARELLLIGESQSLGSQPECSKSLKRGDSQSSENTTSEEEGSSDSDESDEDDWEEVDDKHVEEELHKFDKREEKEGSNATASQEPIPKEGLEIVIPREGVFRKKGKTTTIEDILRSEANRERREIQELLHKASILGQIARGLQLNSAINSSILRPVFVERIGGKKFATKRLDLVTLELMMKWFRKDMIINKPSMVKNLEESKSNLKEDEFLAYQIMETTACDSDYYVLIFAAFLRHWKVDVRLVISLFPIPLKPPHDELFKKPKSERSDDKDDNKKKRSSADDKKNSDKERKKKKPSKKEKDEKKTARQSKSGRNKGRKMISSSDDEESPKKVIPTVFGQDMWVEVYLNEEERWVSVDVLKGKVICDKELEVEATKPITYILAFNKDNKIKDVTRRYASDWLVGTQKLRVKSDWWKVTLKPYRAKYTERDKEEDDYLDEHLMSMPVPKSVSEIKGHPLYVLRRHLLKFEALYPENPPVKGSIKGEPVYSREYVHTLHTRELWMREAKVVRIGETPYKVVKGRPKYDKLSGARLPETPSELFGEWQTEDYIPPIAQNGKVPRNEWGNVELFTEKLLPQGCVHLRLPGLQRIAKKLDIDCAPAVVGFDYGAMGSRPAFDGFVVCEEFKETLLDAWNEDQEEKKKKEEEKRLQRIYGNWRRLIKGVLIRDRLEKKYSVNLSRKRKADEQPTPSTSKSSRTRTKR